MLASLLPGLRELRAPLVAGYVWVVGLWVATGHLFPAADQATGGWAEIYRIAGWVGHPGVLAAVSLAAYLLGVFSLTVTKLIVRLGNLIHRTKLAPLSPGHWRSQQIDNELADVVLDRLSERFDGDSDFRARILQHLRDVKRKSVDEPADNHGRLPFPLEEEEPGELVLTATKHPWRRRSLLDAMVNVPRYVAEAEGDLWHLGRRLIGRDDAVYSEDNRLRAEYEFRIGLVFPLAFLSAVLGIRLHAVAFVGILGSVALLYLAASSATEADLQLVGLVAAHRVESPPIERLMTTDIELRSHDELYIARNDKAGLSAAPPVVERDPPSP